MKKNNFTESHILLKKAEATIPLASQTFSKSYLQYIKGQAPLFASRAEGAYLWDVDGHKYVDMINSLLPVILGYQYPAVDRAIMSQLKKGITFSLSSPLEQELAALLVKHIPGAEMVRFGKNGSDATTGAIRLARAVTGREYVAICEGHYHGWHDWYIGSTTRDLGVPTATKKLTVKFSYNDIGSLERLFKKYPNKIAAVIMEPMNYVEPIPGFLSQVKTLTHKHKSLLIFDEVITGFRFSLGGAQKLFGVTPDLSCFGKSIANGMPLSVLVGRKKYMKRLADIFFSFTNGGEALSLAAALATIKEIERKKVIPYIWRLGQKLQTNTTELLEKHNLADFIQIKGKPCWQVFIIKDAEGYSALEIKSYLQQEIITAGFLWFGSHNMSFAHRQEDIVRLIKAYDGIFANLRKLLDEKKLKQQIKGGLITNIFRVR